MARRCTKANVEYNVDKISIKIIDRDTAKQIVIKKHYMKTFPAGAALFYGIFHGGLKTVRGVAVFGKSSSTNSKCKIFGIKENEILEMQRLWVSDLLGHNAESKILSLIMKNIKQNAPQIKVIWTYAGGCKDDCGIVYQSSGFMFLGSEECNDFYLTKSGEYKNIISALRFSKAPKHLKKKEDIAAYLYGEGELLKTHRHYYFYPICKKIRRVMAKAVKPFPKQSANFRKDQHWVKPGEGDGRTGNGLGSNPSLSTIKTRV